MPCGTKANRWAALAHIVRQQRQIQHDEDPFVVPDSGGVGLARVDIAAAYHLSTSSL
jgi:hypothetical protein